MSKRLSILDVAARKGGEKLVVITCYTSTMARILDSHVDILLVGDSLGMVVYGMDSTLGVTLDMMVAHGKAVAGASKQPLVVVDMPFASYQASKEDAFRSAARIMAETGAQAVKLEGGREMAETVRFLTERGIPVMGHVGLMPQYFNALGGYRYQGRSASEAQIIEKDARAIQEAGAFALVMEGVKETVAREVTGLLSVPTIGIGASPACDGQVLVLDDMLGLTARQPSFVKLYAKLDDAVAEAVADYAAEVKNGQFPSEPYCYPYKK
ncbi:MAG: 3-methyl-2-oxobutanoate hydroxymethyltransferase [Proteobacteria bacterium]|nr:3-methyl-2-oxobutanoate hydroxymethyltransferase [Pseudomonadota bacterium]